MFDTPGVLTSKQEENKNKYEWLDTSKPPVAQRVGGIYEHINYVTFTCIDTHPNFFGSRKSISDRRAEGK